MVRGLDGRPIEVRPLLELYRTHLADYDLDSVPGMTSAPGPLQTAGLASTPELQSI